MNDKVKKYVLPNLPYENTTTKYTGDVDKRIWEYSLRCPANT